eukprot:scaffold132_cov170-Amphora_coffeaeformis.AAC.34
MRILHNLRIFNNLCTQSLVPKGLLSISSLLSGSQDRNITGGGIASIPETTTNNIAERLGHRSRKRNREK